MKKAISILRIAILALMGSVGILFLLGEEQDEAPFTFFLHFLFDKVFCLFHACGHGISCSPVDR